MDGMQDGKNALEIQAEEEKKKQEEYDAEWDKPEGDEDPAKKDLDPENKDEGNGDTPAAEEDPNKDKGADGGLPPDDDKGAGDEAHNKEPVSKDHGDLASMEKALKDTKGSLTKVQQENADLRKLIADRDKGKATDKEVADQKKVVKEALEKFKTEAAKTEEDYPELKSTFEIMHQVLDTLASKTEEIEKKTEEEREEDQRKQAVSDFNAKVKPKILVKHPDYDDVLGIKADGTIDQEKMKEYMTWAEAQRPALRMAALTSPDPEDIIWAVDEFKKAQAKPAAKEQKQKDEKSKTQRLLDAQTLRGSSGGTGPSSGNKGKDKDPNDYDAGWEEADGLMKKQEGGRGG